KVATAVLLLAASWCLRWKSVLSDSIIHIAFNYLHKKEKSAGKILHEMR
ncbi:hypothetical protein Z043_104519, partial [Scleropages formosus]